MFDSDFIPVIKKITIETFDNNSFIISGENINFCKITSAGKNIIDLIDGKRTIQEIFSSIHSFDNKIDYNSFIEFIETIGNCDLIENYAGASAKRKSVFTKISFIKLFTFSSDRFFKTISELLNGKIVIALAAIYCFLIFSALIYFFIHNHQWIISLNTNAFQVGDPATGFYLFLLFIVLTAIKTSLHEIAHGVVCRYYGQPVRGVGLALYLFMPVIFVDTTNIWRVQNKFKRIAVSFAGPFSDFTFLSVLYLFSSLFLRNTVYNNFFEFTCLIYIVRALFNLNPFLKLDGYYIVMDFLEMPNLRQNSFQYLKSLVNGSDNKYSISLKKKIIFLFFGTFSLIATLYFVIRLAWLIVNSVIKSIG